MEIPKKIGPYSVYGTLGSGGYGQVFAAHDNSSKKNYAVKISQDIKCLKKEYKILKTLQKHEEFMKVYEYGSQAPFDYIVMDLFGKNLQYKVNDFILSLKTVSAIGLEILKKIEKMHYLDIIHRDIKPSQFLLTHDQRNLFLIDFGLSTFFKVNGKHKLFKTKCCFKGSIVFSSINTHLGFRLSRRDDLESLVYSLLYLIRGELPWKIGDNSISSKYIKIILSQKLNIKRDYLFRGIPAEFESFFLYCRKLLYDQTPNYSYLKSLLSKFVQTEPIYLNFDWIIDPEFFSKCENKVETKDKLSVLHFKNCNGEFISKRRNGHLNPDTMRRLSRSFDCNEMEDLTKIVYGEINTKKREKKVRRKTRCKSSKPKKIILSTCLQVDTIGTPSPVSSSDFLPLLTPNCLSILSSVSNQSSFILDETYDQECETSRNVMPEFINRDNILRTREVFREAIIEKSSQNNCEIF